MRECDRRARKKAATRALVLETAQRLFAERGFDAVTIADIATTADVAVQTVFNHFATKEELFFTGRAPWVDAPAEAVRTRPAGEPAPSRAAAGRSSPSSTTYIAGLADPAYRGMVTTMSASPALQVYERELAEQRRGRLHQAPGRRVGGRRPQPAGTFRRAAALVAATWVRRPRTVAGRVRGSPCPTPRTSPERAREAAALTDQVLLGLEAALRGSDALDARSGPAQTAADSRSPSTSGISTSSSTRSSRSAVIAPSPAAVYRCQ